MRPVSIFCFFLLFVYSNVSSQTPNQDEIRRVALEIINSAKTCTLITIDSLGFPQARLMDPFLPEENFVIWLGTNPKSHKVAEIMLNPKVNVFYKDPDGTGYVSIWGTAELVDNQELKNIFWKEDFKMFYPDNEKSYVLIKVNPVKMEIVSGSNSILTQEEDWSPAALTFSDN